MKWVRLFGLDLVPCGKLNKKAWFQNWLRGASLARLSKVQGSKGVKRVKRIDNTLNELRTQLTQQFAKSIGGVPGFARKPVNATRKAGGYTIVEVLIVLAISSLILTSSITLFSGQRGKTEFSQAVYDLQSKLQSYASQVSSASLPPGEAYSCAASNVLRDGKVYPVLTTHSSGTQPTTNQECIYLGRAIQVIPTGDTLYIYPVYGLRTIHSGAVDSGDLPVTPAQANPEPALDTEGKFLLVEPYQLLNGLRVVSTTTSISSGDVVIAQDLLTLYSALQSSNTSGSQITASTRSINFVANDVESTRLRSCIEGNICGPETENSLIGKSWNLCVQSSTGDKKAQLAVQGTATGITTKLNLEGCSQ